jgi:ankyrin repeat protein
VDYVDAMAVMKYLIKKGANLDARANDGSSLLHFVAQNATLELLKYLVEEHSAGYKYYLLGFEFKIVRKVLNKKD